MQNMSSIRSDFMPIERAVFRAICDVHSADRAALETQLATATVHSRENTGAGFYTDFSVDRASTTPVGGDRLRQGPEARVAGLKHGMGFIIWLEEGYADCLEGYSYGLESTSEIDFELVDFEILQEEGKLRHD